MQEICKIVESLKFMQPQVQARLKEFEKIGLRENETWYKELCFCILVANSSAKKTSEIWFDLGNRLLTLSQKDLEGELKQRGQRFYRKRAEFLVESRKFSHNLKKILADLSFEEKREFLVKNIKGIGWKEASHFMRNVGEKEFAIIDRHILRILYENKLIGEIPKNLSKKAYFELEAKFRELAQKCGLSPAELDIYLWFFMQKDPGKKVSDKNFHF